MLTVSFSDISEGIGEVYKVTFSIWLPLVSLYGKNVSSSF